MSYVSLLLNRLEFELEKALPKRRKFLVEYIALVKRINKR